MKKYLKKRGKLAKDKEGNLVLVTPQGKAFATTSDIAKVWMLFEDQRPFENIVHEITANAQENYDEIYIEVQRIVSKLKSVKLVEEISPREMQV